MLRIEESACLSAWRERTVETCVLCAGLGACALCLPSLLAGPLVVATAFLLSRVAEVPSKPWLKLLLGGAGFAVISLLPLSLEVRFQGGIALGLDGPGLERGLLALSRSVGTLSATLLLVFTTPFPRLVGLFRRMRVPELVTDLLVLVHGQIFLLDGIWNRLRRSLACRGGVGSNAALRRSLPLGVAALFVHSIHRATRKESGLAARGAVDGALRFPRQTLEVRATGLAAAVAIPAILTVLVLFGKARLGF